MDDAAGDIEPPQKAAGEFLWAHLGEVLQSCEADGFFHQLFSSCLIFDVQPAEIVDILPDGHLLEYGYILHDDANLFLDVVAVGVHVFAEDGDSAFVVLQKREKAVDGSGLAGAVGPQESEDFALVYGKVQVVKGH
ncbi:hypothetical protein IMSAGC018_02126 [Lachnospiraceae bacterium]|nr:hypothetical protein IMSAGC018_02126 [Lachnospiraceae bacterium]